MKLTTIASLLFIINISSLQAASNLDALVTKIEPEVIEWRHHLHQHPELSNREFETAKYITQRLKDFSFFQEQVPGLFLWVGGKRPDVTANEPPAHHTPDFYVDDSGLKPGLNY